MANRTPEQRREHGRRTYLIGAAKATAERAEDLTPEQAREVFRAIVDRAPLELTPEQAATIRTLLPKIGGGAE